MTENFLSNAEANCHVCVASKKKIHLSRPVLPPESSPPDAMLDPDDLANLKYELYHEIPLSRHAPNSILWHKSNFILAYPREYVLVLQQTGQAREICQLDGKTVDYL